MNEERRAFEDAIRRNRYDGVTRKVFADWLDEHDEPEAADRQRRWTPEKQREAEEWLGGFADQVDLSYAELLEAANRSLDTGYGHCLPFDTPDIAFEGMPEFWRHFEVVTDRPVPEEKRGTFFRCAC